jgi:RNA polymerase sigma-70 factor (ECF subfamily)
MSITARPVSVVDSARVPPWSRSAEPSPGLLNGPTADTGGAPRAGRPGGSGSVPDGTPDDGDGFDRFFAHVLPRTLRAARQLTGDPRSAEDVAKQAFARAHLRWARIAPLPWRDAWVLNVASKQALRHVRRHPPTPAPGHNGNGSDDAELRRELVASVLRLPRRQRETFVLRYVCGLPEADVALALGMSARTARTHLRSALAALRANIGFDIKEAHVHELRA